MIANQSQTFIEYLISMDQTQRRALNFLTHLEKENYVGSECRHYGEAPKGNALV